VNNPNAYTILPSECFLLSSGEGGEEEENLGEMWENVSKENFLNTSLDNVLPLRSHFSLPNDLSMFARHLFIVGFSDNLLVQVKPRYLNESTKEIL
jgi:hypothetical protein